MAYTTLEDYFGDIVGKSRRGQGISEADLALSAGLTASELARIEAYELTPDDARIGRLAMALNLDAGKLTAVARGWVPENANDCLKTARLAVDRLILDMGGMKVNCYFLICKASGEAAVVDPGTEGRRILGEISRLGLKVTHILVTHAHGDHVGALREVSEATGAAVCCGRGDIPLLERHDATASQAVEDGWTTEVGKLEVRALALPGHTPGGTAYATDHAVFTGDALFAGSLGGATGQGYPTQIRAVRTKVLSLNREVRIFPGHGPITTVEQETGHNPFVA